MLRRVLVAEQGESPFLPGERVDARFFAETNRQLVQEASGRPRGARSSWASPRRRYHRQLAVGRFVPGDHSGPHEAAIEGKSDLLFGLKENIIIGKLIPAGTGCPLPGHRRGRARSRTYDVLDLGRGARDRDLAAWLASIGSSTGTDGSATFETRDYQDSYGYAAGYETGTEPVFDVGDDEVPG